MTRVQTNNTRDKQLIRETFAHYELVISTHTETLAVLLDIGRGIVINKRRKYLCGNCIHTETIPYGSVRSR